MKRANQRQRVELRKNLRRSILRGHPWVFDRAVVPNPKLRPGEVVDVCDESGAIAVAVFDPSSPIRLRILDLDPHTQIDNEWLRVRVRRAARRRQGDCRLVDTNARRFVHGEADGLPGLVLDMYAGHAIVLLDGAGAQEFYAPRAEAIKDGIRDAGCELLTMSMRRVGRERRWLQGEPPPTVTVQEGAATFEVDLLRGQKTGLFLDQRENRRLVGQYCAGARVLNLFGYTGGFSLAAALNGAARVCTVDIAAPAIAAAKRNFSLSGLKPNEHEFVAMDAFEFLDGAVSAGRQFDVVVCDPPSFASSEKALKKGLQAYRQINARALQVVAPQGIFCSASCSSHVTAEHLLGVLADASQSVGRNLVVQDQRGAATDHPVHPGFVEGRYLSFYLCSVD